ncbi:MAG: hypothetical protein H7A35_05810 [Planctomycetales bacterium]|nr:hypothetical protein [bacterium]UNM09575.1 MAG: hypothetical protein H7A35_05810 [Planctomycetales bacterium]
MGITLLAILLLASCSGGHSTMRPDGLDGVRLLEGTSADSVRLVASGNDLLLELQPGSRGAFVEVTPSFDARYFDEQWSADEGTVHMVHPIGNSLQVGVAPTPEYSGQPVSLRLSRGSVDRSISSPPDGNINKVQDLKVADLGGGNVLMEWTELNWADYDHNGEVGISDITPLGIYFGQAGPWQPSEPQYWVDGDGNGVITLADITPIGQRYGTSVKGYNTYRVAGSTPPAFGLLQFADAAEATVNQKLPRTYSVTVSSPPDGTFTVRPVDFGDLEGIESVAAVLSGAPNLELNLDITGQTLYDQVTGLPSTFTNDTVILRIIDDIKEVNAIEYGTVTPLADGQFSVSGLPQGQALFLQVAYAPTVDLATGGAKAPARAISGTNRRTSEIPEGAEVTTIPIRLPVGDDPVVLNTAIDLGMSNPSGGFFVNLDDTQDIPGDNPATPAIENGYTIQRDLRLDYVDNLLSGDTDADLSFVDEPELRDSDRDCLSAKREEQVLDDDDAYESRPEIEIEGTVTGFDSQNGLIFLTNAIVEVGETEKPLPNDVVVYFTEFTPFEFRNKITDEEGKLNPDDILAGDLLKIDLYALEDTGDILPTKYWVEHVRKVTDN